MLERLQKIISAAGVTSRRAAEQLIAEGRVRVNGAVVTELGTKADASKDHIKVDGKLINPKQPPTYLMLNKPAGFVTTMSDPEGRPTVQDLLKGVKTRVYPVGRLDYNTEGLLLMTNDGDFAHLITHPKHEFPKTYLAKVKGILDEKQIALLENGMYLQDGRTAPAKVKKIRKEEANSWVEITIHEGRKRQVRRMFDHVGRSVIKLKRVRTGTLSLGDLAEGSFRHLTAAEVKGLLETAMKTDDVPMPISMKPEIKRPEQATRPRQERAQQPGPARRTDSRVATQGEKKAHKGRIPDLRPWRREDSRTKGSATSAARGPRAGSSFTRGDKRPRPAFGAGTGRTTPGTASRRPTAGAPAWKTDARRKPGAGRPEGRSSAPRGSAFGRGPQGDTRRPGAPAWKTDERRKPGAGRPEGRSSAPQGSAFGRGTQGDTRRPSAKPRPNKSAFPGRKGPARGSGPGPRGRGQGASGRGPRR